MSSDIASVTVYRAPAGGLVVVVGARAVWEIEPDLSGPWPLPVEIDRTGWELVGKAAPYIDRLLDRGWELRSAGAFDAAGWLCALVRGLALSPEIGAPWFAQERARRTAARDARRYMVACLREHRKGLPASELWLGGACIFREIGAVLRTAGRVPRLLALAWRVRRLGQGEMGDLLAGIAKQLPSLPSADVVTLASETRSWGDKLTVDAGGPRLPAHAAVEAFLVELRRYASEVSA